VLAQQRKQGRVEVIATMREAVPRLTQVQSACVLGHAMKLRYPPLQVMFKAPVFNDLHVPVQRDAAPHPEVQVVAGANTEPGYTRAVRRVEIMRKTPDDLPEPGLAQLGSAEILVFSCSDSALRTRP
jgi:hypothetical protein